jgi:hypothetical protein
LPDWLAERGIGETRLVRVQNGEIVEARILLDDIVRAGSVLEARLISRGVGGRNAVAAAADGTEFLLPRGAGGVTEGAPVRVEVTRERIPGSESWKRPLARVTDQPAADAPADDGDAVPFPAPQDQLAAAGWNDLIEEARSGIVRFAGGELSIEPTRAMTMIDVDGLGEPHDLALLGAAAAARAILRLDLQGSIGIDLPTAAGKEVRQRAAAVVDAILPQPFERTAVNGFGFLQIVRPRRRASLIELARDSAAFEARAALRHAGLGHGTATMVVHPKIAALLKGQPQWLDALARQRGGAIDLRTDAARPMSAWHVDQS